MITTLIGATLLSFTLGQLGRISFLDQSVNIYLYEVFLVCTAVVLAYKTGWKAIKKELEGRKSIVVFFGILAVTFLVTASSYPSYTNLIGALYLGRLSLYFAYFILLSVHADRNKSLIGDIHKYLRWAIYVVGATSVLQIVLYPDLRNLFYLGWDEHLGRVFGLFLDTSAAGAVYGLCLLYLYGMRSAGRKAENTALMALFAVLCILTYSRSLYIALLISTALLISKNKQVLKWAGIGLVVLVLSALVLYKPSSEGTNLLRTASINARVTDYKEGFRIFGEQPFTGVGYNRIGWEKNQPDKGGSIPNHAASSFHSSFLILLATAGVGGLISFIWVLADIARRSSQALTYVVFLSAMSLFDNILFYPFIMLLFFTLLVVDRKEVLRK